MVNKLNVDQFNSLLMFPNERGLQNEKRINNLLLGPYYIFNITLTRNKHMNHGDKSSKGECYLPCTIVYLSL